MAAPQLTFSITGNKISAVSGFDSITVSFSSDIAYTAFEWPRDEVRRGLGPREGRFDRVILPDPGGNAAHL